MRQVGSCDPRNPLGQAFLEQLAKYPPADTTGLGYEGGALVFSAALAVAR